MGMFDFLTPGLGSTIAGLTGFLGQQETNSANQANAQTQMDFQERLSNSAYQRQVADMSAAGLNPMLAYMKGGGASTPTGAMATFQSPASAGVNAALTASQSSRTQAEIPYIQSNTQLNQTEIAKVEQSTNLIKAQIDQIKGDTNFAVQQDKLKQTAFMLQQQAVNYQESGMTTGKQRAVMEETIKNLKNTGSLQKLDIDAAKAFDNFGRTSKELLPVIEIIKSILLPRGIR